MPPHLVVRGITTPSKASGGKDLQVEHPVCGRYSPAFHFYATLPGMLSAPLIRHEVVQMGEARETCLLTPVRMMEPLHHEQLPLHGVMGLIQQGARHGHLRVGEHGIPEDEVGEDREHGCARGALDTPDREPTQPDTGIVRVARQAAPCVAAGFVEELKAEREKEGEDELDKRFGVGYEGKVGRLIVEVDGNRPVVAGRCSGLSHGSPSVEMVAGADETS
jgi:hypothetical protein